MNFRFGGALLCLGLLLSGAPAFAHHSFAAEFDEKVQFELTGVLSKVEWINPHTYFRLDVKDETGKVTTWAIESFGPSGLRRAGLSRAGLFKVGDTYTVTVFGAKDGSKNLAWAKEFKFSDGRVVKIGWGDVNDVR